MQWYRNTEASFYHILVFFIYIKARVAQLEEGMDGITSYGNQVQIVERGSRFFGRSQCSVIQIREYV